MQHIPIRTTGHFSIRRITGLDMVQPLHRHDFYYLLALTSATGTHTIDFVPYPVNNNSLFLLRPGQVHEIALSADSTGYLLQCSPSFDPSPLLRTAARQNHYQCNPPLFENILEEFTTQKNNYEDVIRSYLHILFITLLREQTTSLVNDDLQTLLDLIELHYTQYKQVSDYATLLHRSPYQLNSLTKQSLGKTCSDLINAHILLEAKRRLLATSDQINEIAWQLGYEDNSYFIRFFKKHTGHTPAVFRQNSR
jgi:AraC-like DNA-binding protein